MEVKLTRRTHKVAIKLRLVAESCTQFSLQAASAETFGYTLIIGPKYFNRLNRELHGPQTFLLV